MTAQVPRGVWFLVLGILCTLTLVRIVSTHRILSPTGDEHTHIATGGEWVMRGRYTYDVEHPPLAWIMFALPLVLWPVSQHDPFPPRPGRAGSWTQQERLHLVPLGNYMESVARARLGNLVFVVLAITGVAYLGAVFFGRLTGLVAAGVFVLLPPILAHGALCTTDMAVTAALPWALLALRRWLARSTWSAALSFSAVAGLALLTKFSFIFYFGLCAIVLVGAARRLPPLRQILLSGCMIALIIWSVYRFDHGRLARMYPEASAVSQRFLGSSWIVRNLNIPAPRFFYGILVVLLHNERGHPAYLLGEVRQFGWWYYFPVALAVKTPLPMLLLAGAGAWLIIRRRIGWELALMATLILGCAMTSHINLGLRHILPVYPLLAIIAAHAAVTLRGGRHLLSLALGAWLAFSSFLAHPDYLPWMNALAGSRPEHVLLESNFDWGQDVLRLAEECRRLRVQQLGYRAFGNVDADRIGLPFTKPVDPHSPSSGWIAVSEGEVVFAQAQDPHAYAWLTNSHSYRRIGRTIRLYQITGDQGSR